ncbi:MFS transporter [Kitasatospora sp. CB01950]|uniref:MFS transporter n=1 Tax=Kitasatospora sp. CB01950 TaxID=1703930 RepID=UPI00093E6832|nr:MFS transporter [Kitasatospora sp. CB01950]OKJ08229.1 MFS transporter [Kitasatospora sp. CB01950]
MAEPAVAPRLLDTLPGTLQDVLQRAERPRPRAVARWPHAHWLAVGTVCVGAFLGQLTASVTSLVFPALEHRFDAGFAAVEWVSLSYLLVLVALLAPVGRLSDLVGRKTMYLGGFAVFAAASLGAGLADSLAVLVACRAVQAVGGAMMQANSVALVARGVPERAMRTALGIQAAAQALGLALGPTLGGLLVTHASWRWAFWVNVPIGVLGILAGWFLLPRTFPAGRREARPEGNGGRVDLAGGRSGAGRVDGGRVDSGRAGRRSGGGRFDVAGLLLLGTASTALLLALSAASGLPLPGWAVAALALLAVVAAAGLVRQERRADRPIVPPGLVNTPGIRAGLVVALIGYLLLFCPLVLEPVMLAGRGVPAATAGLVITALPAAFALAATVGGALLPRGWGDAVRCRAGALLAAAGLLALALLPGSGPGAVVPLLVAGYGLGLLLPANNALVMRAIPAQSSAVGGGLVNMVRSLGTALGTALPVLAVHLAGPAVGGRVVLLLLAAVALPAARLSAG